MENRIACPACGVEQDAGAECAHCGLIFSKFKSGQRPPSPPPPQESRVAERYKASIGTASRAIRAVIPVVTLALIALLILNGFLTSGFQGYVVIVVLGATALYYIFSSLLETITLDRFYTEGILFVFLMVGIRCTYAEYFDIEAIRFSPPPKQTMASMPSEKKPYVLRVGDLARDLGASLAKDAFVEVEDLALSQVPVLHGLYAQMPAPERLRLHALDKDLKRVSTFLSRPEPWDDVRKAAFAARLAEVQRSLAAIASP